ncbi:hypothetical protein I7I51_06566 [Histoplasma capsulatum]|uniref:Uncharacterized protein n=1 Tax=Ajellomyces capsulatus TaxID=5037 RepID=A0A8A1MGI6_AJECA|nr:hypothetical protein I7I51_06566 [Histoplasma capsulatum]
MDSTSGCGVVELTGAGHSYFPSKGHGLKSFSKTILYLGPAFVSALNNYTFALWISIQRLTPYDIKAQPGAPIALGIMITIILSIMSTKTLRGSAINREMSELGDQRQLRGKL